jgi:hypothetical protein
MKEQLDEILKANPNAPTDDESALSFARQLLPPTDQRVEEAMELSFAEGSVKLAASEESDYEWCGEYTLGLLEAVLESTLISPDAKSEIETMMVDAMPALEKEKTIGHFHFLWTEVSADSRDNVTEADIDATAAALNDSWNLYVANFRQPKANLVGGVRIVDVEVYFKAGLYGSTSSHTNKIFLNSRDCVRDTCRRLTTSAHELFHRVQYAYGYVTGTGGQTWWVEGTASWSQDFCYDHINDYVTRIDGGLTSPDRSLLERSYDACHYWKYFGEQLHKRSTAVTSEGQAMKEFLATYSSNGLNAQAASSTVTLGRISRNFNQHFQDWSKANYIKNLDHPGIRYAYDENDEVTTSCGRTYGPYRQVAPTVDRTISSNTYTWTSPIQTTNAYGSDYLVFNIAPAVTRISIRFEGNPTGGAGRFSAHLIMIKDNHWRVIYNSPSTTEQTFDANFAAGTYDRAVLVVNSLATGGQYEVSVNACMSGIWVDNYNFIWTLVQSGTDISGTVLTRHSGTYTVAGKLLHGKDITLKASGSGCDFEYKGTITDCKEGAGNWTNDCGMNGSWTMRRTDAASAEAIFEGEEMEIAEDPTTASS